MEFHWVTRKQNEGRATIKTDMGTMSVYVEKKSKYTRLQLSIRRDIITSAGMSLQDSVRFGFNNTRAAIKLCPDGIGSRLLTKEAKTTKGNRVRVTFLVTDDFPPCFKNKASAVPMLDVQTGLGIITFSIDSTKAWANANHKDNLTQEV